MVLRKGKVEIGNSGFLSEVRTQSRGLAMIQQLLLKWLVDQLNSLASRCQFRKLRLTVLFMMIYLPCAVCSAGNSKLFPPNKDLAGALRLARITQIATREEILKLGAQREHLLASGLKDASRMGALPAAASTVVTLRLMKGQPCGSMFRPTSQ